MSRLKFIPIKDKIPQIPAWQTSEEEFEIPGDRGLVTGLLSDNLEVLDLDLKYELTGDLMKRYSDLVKMYDPDLLSTLTTQKTANNGYHLMYRCSEIEGNLKLASRPTTIEEKLRDPHLKVMVLIETRGLGGQIAVVPTPGYKLVRGTLETIPTITIAQREILITCARAFNEVVEVVKHKSMDSPSGVGRLSPWLDYNLRADVAALLESKGWTFVFQKGNKLHFKRPGQTDALTSGNWDIEKGLFSVFSTSTEFEINKGYKPFGVYAMLAHGNDAKEAANTLYKHGYGERNEYKPVEELKISQVNTEDDDFSFLADDAEMKSYHSNVRDGTFEMGLCTGSVTLDKHIRYKRGNLVMINGSDNVGKTTTILYLFVLYSKYNKLKWFLYTTENSNGSISEDIMVFYIGKQLKDMATEEYDSAWKFFKEHFFLVRRSEKMYNVDDAIAMARKMDDKFGIDGFLVDPWYSVLSDLDNQNEHAYSYKAIRQLKMFGNMTGTSIYVNIHLATNASRKVDADGHMLAPQKSDAEGGNKFGNVADDFYTIHRKTQHKEYWMVTELHVRKTKEPKTGGKNTIMDEPILLSMNPQFTGFKIIGDEQKAPVAPKNSIVALEENRISERPEFNDWYSKIERKGPVGDFSQGKDDDGTAPF